MKSRLLTEANDALEIMIDSQVRWEQRRRTNFRRLLLAVLVIIILAQLFINFVGCYLIKEFAYRADFNDIAKALTFFVAVTNFLIAVLELIFVSLAIKEKRTSKK